MEYLNANIELYASTSLYIMHILNGGKTMPNYMRRKLIVYLIGIFALAIGSNLFLNAALGVAPS